MSQNTSHDNNPFPYWPARLLILSMLLLAFGLLVHPLGDPDVFIHLRDGRYWVENKLHVGQDPFGYTIPDKPIEKVEVLFRIGIYLAYQIGGYSLLTIGKALAMTAAFLFVGILIYRRWQNLGVVWILLAAALLAPMQRIFPERPYVATYLLLPWLLLLLDDYRRSEARQENTVFRHLWIIPVCIIPWANLHPGFTVFLGFLGVHVLEHAFQFWRTQDVLFRRKALRLALIGGLSFLAGAFNPIGFSVYSFVLQTTSSHDFMKFLTEWAPPTFSREPVFFLLLGAVWVVQLLAVRRLRLSDLLPMAVFSYLAVKSYRNIPLFLISALPPFADHLSFLWHKYFPALHLKAFWRSRILCIGAGLTFSVLIWATITGYAFRLGLIPGMYPGKALAWLLDHPLRGRLLTHDIWGGYTGWMTEGRIQVFIDGRFPLFGEKLYSDYRKMIWGDPHLCLSLLDFYHIQGLLVSPKNEIRLYQQLWNSKNWALVYWDDVASLYVRKSKDNQSLLEPFQYFAVDPKHNPYFNPGNPELALQESRRAAEINPDSFLPWFFAAELSLRLGRKTEAHNYFMEVLKRAPGHVGSLHNLGVMAWQEQNYHDAERYLRKVLKHPVSPQLAGRSCYMLALVVKMDRSRKKEAIAWARRALKNIPGWKEAEALLQELTFNTPLQ
ncbi:tetratricopeptide repeat protein [candidate division FCPU426 bacterium]|nr:tetratricopeptide repeat protein [candidate division FCPU426 bacterium]